MLFIEQPNNFSRQFQKFVNVCFHGSLSAKLTPVRLVFASLFFAEHNSSLPYERLRARGIIGKLN